MHRTVFLATSLLLCGTAFAQAGYKLSPHDPSALIEPKNLVRRFCQMDAEGFRLNRETEKRLQAATTWKDLPEWYGFVVISQFEVLSAKANARGVLVTVSYSVLGHFDTGAGFSQEKHVDTVEVQVIEDKDEWKVLGADELVRPRISRLRTLKWLREQLATEQDPHTRRALEHAMAQLQ